MNRPYGEEPDCQRCIREGIVSLWRGHRGYCHARKVEVLNFTFWQLSDLSALEGGTRHRWILQSSALLSAAPPTGLRINAPLCWARRLELNCSTEHPSTVRPCAREEAPLQVQVVILMWTRAIKGDSCELAWHMSKSSCSFALQPLQRGTWHRVELAASRQFKKRGQRTHTVNWALLSSVPCFPFHTSEELRFINMFSVTGARSHDNALNTNETRPDSQTAEAALFHFSVPLGRIYNRTSIFSGCKVKVTNHGFIWPLG